MGTEYQVRAVGSVVLGVVAVAVQVVGGSVAAESVEQRLLNCGQLAPQLLAASQQAQEFAWGQCVEIQAQIPSRSSSADRVRMCSYRLPSLGEPRNLATSKRSGTT